MLFKQALLVFLFFTLFYIGTRRVASSTDTIVTTFLPISIIRGNGFDLEKVYPTIRKLLPSKVGDSGLPYYVIKENNHILSTFPVFSSLVATPIYLLPVLVKNVTLDNLDNHINLILSLGKISASTFSGISAALVFLCLKELLNTKKSLMLTTLYALGTSTLSISSQSFWQHAASQMFLASTIYVFVKGQKNKKLLPLCGLFLGFAAVSRFPNLIIAIAFSAYFVFFERKKLLNFVWYSTPAILFFAWYQITYPGNLFFYKYEAIGEIASFNHSFLKGFSGLLFAPNKGLFIYSPIFLLSIWGIIIAWRKKLKALRFFSVVIFLYIAFVAKWSAWHGGWSYGPRMLADITPFLILLTSPVANDTKIWTNFIFKRIFWIIGFVSVFIHFLGATVADFSWYSIQTMFLPIEKAKEAEFLWNWKYPEIYSFYLDVGGFFGIIYVFSREITHITLTIIKGFVAVVLLYLLITFVKSANKNLTRITGNF